MYPEIVWLMLLKITQNIFKGSDLLSEGKVLNNCSIHSVSINRDMHIFIHFPLSGPIKDSRCPKLPFVSFYCLFCLTNMWGCEGDQRVSVIPSIFHFRNLYNSKNKARTYRFSKCSPSFWISQCLYNFSQVSAILWEAYHLITAHSGIPGCNIWNLTYFLYAALWQIFNYLPSFCCFAVGNTEHATPSPEF